MLIIKTIAILLKSKLGKEELFDRCYQCKTTWTDWNSFNNNFCDIAAKLSKKWIDNKKQFNLPGITQEIIFKCPTSANEIRF